MKDVLVRGQVHLWWMRPDAVSDPLLLRKYERLLTEDELRQRDRFHFPMGRHEYLVTRVLVRTTLSRYTGVPPDRWRFVKGAHGRPELSGPSIAPRLSFNVSHTKGFVACLIALDRQVGVDVENTARDGRILEIADRYFSPSEVRALRSLPHPARWDRFFEYWTLKESFIKAMGVGISFGLSRFSFDLDERPIRISFEPEIPEDADRWQFSLRWPLPGHVVATSVRREKGEDVQLVLHETVPLAPMPIG